MCSTYQNVNNKGADQTAHMRRLVRACVVRKLPKTGFLALRPIFIQPTAASTVNMRQSFTAMSWAGQEECVCVWGGGGGGGGGRVWTLWNIGFCFV